MKELSTKGMFFNDLDQAERDTLVAVAILQIMHAQPRFDASPNQDGGNVISVYAKVWSNSFSGKVSSFLAQTITP